MLDKKRNKNINYSFLLKQRNKNQGYSETFTMRENVDNFEKVQQKKY